jgi:hypothetical protein
MMKLHMTHDLSCALGELGSAARRYALPKALSSEWPVTGELSIAAVAFTIQLAIEEGGNPADLRKLERELIAKLKTPT